MTIYTDWKVIVAHPQPGGTMTVTGGIPDEQFDLTPYVRGFDVIEDIEFGQVAEATLSLSLENTAGGFTPQKYDDGFAYDADRFYNNGLNWYDTWLIYVLGYADTTDGTTLVSIRNFIPTDVEFTDDGFTSKIEVTGRDYITWLERQPLATLAISGDNARVVLNTLLEQHTDPFGADEYDIALTPLGVQIQYGDVDLVFPDGVTVAEVYRQIAANENLLFFPIYIGQYSPFAFISTTLVAMSLGVITTQSLSPHTDRVFRFTDPSSIAAGRTEGLLAVTYFDLLPYRALQFGTTTDRVTTQAQMENTNAVASLSQNATSLATYGPRSAQFTSTPPTTLSSGGTEQDFLDAKALILTTWWDTVENYVEGIEVTGGMIEQFCHDDALPTVELLMDGGYYYMTLIDIVGAGGTSTQAKNTFLRSVLSVNATDWVVRLERGIGSTSGFGLRLDDTEIGVLDENRVAAPT